MARRSWIAKGAGARLVWADARVPAVPFYEHLGATAEGQVFRDDLTGLNDRRIIFAVPVHG